MVVEEVCDIEDSCSNGDIARLCSVVRSNIGLWDGGEGTSWHGECCGDGKFAGQEVGMCGARRGFKRRGRIERWTWVRRNEGIFIMDYSYLYSPDDDR